MLCACPLILNSLMFPLFGWCMSSSTHLRQTVSFLTILQKEYHMGGPFLIIAPLSTVMHWQREFQNWSDMNTIIYHGSQVCKFLPYLRSFFSWFVLLW